MHSGRPALSRVKKAAATKISLFAYLWQMLCSWCGLISMNYQDASINVLNWWTFWLDFSPVFQKNLPVKPYTMASTGHSQQNMAKGRYDMVETPKVLAI